MSFLTAASDRSSSGRGVSGVSGASFSGVSGLVSSFSFTTAVVLVLLAIQCLLASPPGARITTAPLPYGDSPRPWPHATCHTQPDKVPTPDVPAPSPKRAAAHASTARMAWLA